MNTLDLETKINTILEDCLYLVALFKNLEADKTSLFTKIETNKKWLLKQPDYGKFLQHLQTVLHQKNIGAFSELLSYFVKDVLKKDKDIVLELYTYHNLPALRIEALNQGCKENIYEGNGGSIANIVSTGLRLITLSRLSHRKFIILDEPDCWLKPEHIPLFAKIIGEISSKLKIQTVIISHHKWEYFKNYGKVVELKSDGKNLYTETIHEVIQDDLDLEKEDYIRSIRLRQFMSHTDTELQFHPYLTCLTGENDLGKSVFSTAFKAFAYNDSSDSYIQHHKSEAQILITLSENRNLLWQRFLQTTQENPQKVKYSLFKGNDLIASEFNSDSTPKFISDELNILTTEDIDVHIGNQKTPVFLLGSDVKPQERAKILSLGRESLIIQKMMENLKTKTKTLKSSLKEDESRYFNITRSLNVLDNIENQHDKLSSIKKSFIEYKNKQIQIEELKTFLKEFKTISLLNNINKIRYNLPKLKFFNTTELNKTMFDLYVYKELSLLTSINRELPKVDFKNTQDLTKTINRLYWTEKAATISKINNNPIKPVFKNISELKQIINQIQLHINIGSLDSIEYQKLKSIDNDKKHQIIELKQMIESINNKKDELSSLQEKQNNLKVWEIKINKEIEDFLALNQSLCPTCKQTIDKQHIWKNSYHD